MTALAPIVLAIEATRGLRRGKRRRRWRAAQEEGPTQMNLFRSLGWVIVPIVAGSASINAARADQILMPPVTAGMTLKNWCDGAFVQHNVVIQFQAEAFVTGVYDAIEIEERLNRGRAYCIPLGVQFQQLTLVACKFISDHPESPNLPAAELTLDSFTTYWPCSQ